MSRADKLADFISKVQGQLIVSCQSSPEEALFGADIMAKMAIAAVRGGAVAIRANSPEDIKAIREALDVPIIGIYKVKFPGTPVKITATIRHALEIAAAGADIIAVDCTFRPHPEDAVPELIRKIRAQCDCLVIGDISTFEEAKAAMEAGVDLVSTTLSVIPTIHPTKGSDLELVRIISETLDIPVFAEGRYHTPEDVCQALKLGANAVVVGSADYPTERNYRKIC